MSRNGIKIHLASSQPPVFLLELGHSLLEVGVMGFAPIAGVLSCDAVTVSAGLFALFRCEFRAGTFARRAIVRWRRG